METERSATCTVYPIVTALDKADDMIGAGHIWLATNGTQEIFVPIFNSTRTKAKLIKDIKSIASRNADEINKFLADEGFAIKLDPFKEPGDFGTASVLDVLVNWLVEGEIVDIRSGRDLGASFPGVSLIAGVYFARSPAHTEPVVVIETKSGDRVCMTVHDQCESFELLNRAKCLQETMTPNSDFRGVIFPQVSLDQKVDISWLQNLHTTGKDGRGYEVVKALQQTKFRMNEKGARAQSAVTIGFRTTGIRVPPPPPLVIDRPFLVWIFRKRLPYPLFTGWIAEEDWKTPKDISNKVTAHNMRKSNREFVIDYLASKGGISPLIKIAHALYSKDRIAFGEEPADVIDYLVGLGDVRLTDDMVELIPPRDRFATEKIMLFTALIKSPTLSISVPSAKRILKELGSQINLDNVLFSQPLRRKLGIELYAEGDIIYLPINTPEK